MESSKDRKRPEWLKPLGRMRVEQGRWSREAGRAGRPWAAIAADVYPECKRKPSKGFKLGSEVPNYLFESPLWLCGEWFWRTKE